MIQCATLSPGIFDFLLSPNNVTAEVKSKCIKKFHFATVLNSTIYYMGYLYLSIGETLV